MSAGRRRVVIAQIPERPGLEVMGEEVPCAEKQGGETSDGKSPNTDDVLSEFWCGPRNASAESCTRQDVPRLSILRKLCCYCAGSRRGQ